ncbi:rhamnulokinase [Arthrobacter dokdonensis]|uniref:rhamnulokinase n=1 Tax=Arthrobacter dokdonellae TaxID=2211210 RepID=UPI000DE5C151|nr:rhamnulokinase family protein [Arthrobacter dokdonellae]
MNDTAETERHPAAARGGEAFVAIDIGASSGRVMLGRVNTDTGAVLETVHRFPNGVQEIDGALRWDFGALFAEVLTGLSAAAVAAALRAERIASIGIDTWAVDYGLVDAAGALVAQPHSYRDGRSNAAVARVHQALGPERLYATTGLQFLPFNTIYQLASEASLAGLQALLIPDLIAFRLTGARRTEATNASTTGLFDAVAGEWATEFFTVLGLPAGLFPPLIQPGETVGTLLPAVAAATGLPGETRVVAVGSHDTASAVAAVPAAGRNFAYVSSGTWSLVGVELTHPVLTEASRAANFTNERSVDGTIRYLRNTGGLWLLSESMRTWTQERRDTPAAGSPAPAARRPGPALAELLAAAAAEPAGGPLIDVDAEAFIAPGNMPARILAAANAAAAALENRPAAVVRCVLDSLAAAYARTVHDASALSGQAVDVIHIVGGGSQNTLLCQLTADATGKKVIAGPVEATALGNVLIQARAAGTVTGGPDSLRGLVAAGTRLKAYEPSAAPESMVRR